MARRDANTYRQAIPALELSIERCTPQVPDDGYYYVCFKGEIKGRHRSLRAALVQYRSIVAESGWRPDAPRKRKVHSAPEAVERYMDALEDYWSGAHVHRRRGGKARSRS